MAIKQSKKLTAFRAESDLRERLDSEENASRILNEALRLYYHNYSRCPTCHGSGKIKERDKSD